MTMLYCFAYAHQLGGRPVRDGLGCGVPLGVLRGAEVGAGENLLEAQHLHPLAARVIDEGLVGLEHRLAVLLHGRAGVELVGHLDDAGLDDAGHVALRVSSGG
jgi:hypothetical protein